VPWITQGRGKMGQTAVRQVEVVKSEVPRRH